MFGYVSFVVRQRCLGESMTRRRRGVRSPDRAHRGAVADGAGDNPAGDSADEAGLVRFAAATRGRVTGPSGGW